MIAVVATFSHESAVKCLYRGWPEDPALRDLRRVWIGFDQSDRLSPLCDEGGDKESLVVRMADWDRDADAVIDAIFRGADDCSDEPTAAHARAVVAFVLAQHAQPEPVALAVHCYAGLYRSGAVAEWARTDLGVAESARSERIVHGLSLASMARARDATRTYNATFLRLLREEHATWRPSK